jgi:hypothetical protein
MGRRRSLGGQRGGAEEFVHRAGDAGGGAGFVQRVAAQAVAQRGGRDAAEVLAGDLRVALEGRERAGGAEEGEFAPEAVGAEGDAELGAVDQRRSGVSRARMPSRAARMRLRSFVSCARQRFMKASWSVS